LNNDFVSQTIIYAYSQDMDSQVVVGDGLALVPILDVAEARIRLLTRKIDVTICAYTERFFGYFDLILSLDSVYGQSQLLTRIRPHGHHGCYRCRTRHPYRGSYILAPHRGRRAGARAVTDRCRFR
jgi:hypothetical protein